MRTAPRSGTASLNTLIGMVSVFDENEARSTDDRECGEARSHKKAYARQLTWHRCSFDSQA